MKEYSQEEKDQLAEVGRKRGPIVISALVTLAIGIYLIYAIGYKQLYLREPINKEFHLILCLVTLGQSIWLKQKLKNW